MLVEYSHYYIRLLCISSSACILSNETVNIWSHMLGLVYFTLLQINDNFHFLPENGADAGDHFTFTIMNLCFQVKYNKEAIRDSHMYMYVHCAYMYLAGQCPGILTLYQESVLSFSLVSRSLAHFSSQPACIYMQWL